MKNKGLGKVKITPIEKQGDWGLYVWKLPNGKILGDADGNVLNIPGASHDLAAMLKIQQAATEYGYPDGAAVFKAHVSRISEDEYAEQVGRMKAGLIPSYTDQGAWADVRRTEQQWGVQDD